MESLRDDIVISPCLAGKQSAAPSSECLRCPERPPLLVCSRDSFLACRQQGSPGPPKLPLRLPRITTSRRLAYPQPNYSTQHQADGSLATVIFGNVDHHPSAQSAKCPAFRLIRGNTRARRQGRAPCPPVSDKPDTYVGARETHRFPLAPICQSHFGNRHVRCRTASPSFRNMRYSFAGSMTARCFDRQSTATYMLLTENRVRTGQRAPRARPGPAFRNCRRSRCSFSIDNPLPQIAQAASRPSFAFGPRGRLSSYQSARPRLDRARAATYEFKNQACSLCTA